jgi:uncharacterized protein (TIGR02646 family)
MIKTIKVKEPFFFKSDKVKDYKKVLSRHFAKDLSVRSQTKFPISNVQEVLLNNDVEIELLNKTSNKCAYCESVFKDSEVSIDHYRPHYSAADLEGKISPDHYWWLAFNWNNLFPVCQECNTNKRNYFPVSRNRATVKYYGKDTLFNKEYPVFIDPEFENPEEYFYYDRAGKIYAETDRGKVTIDFLALNRTDLVEARKKVVIELEDVFNEIKEIGSSTANFETIEGKIFIHLEKFENSFYSNKQSYLGIRRYMLRLYFLNSKNEAVKNYISSKFKRKLNFKFNQELSFEDIPRSVFKQFEIDTISIWNYKSINKISLNFSRTKSGNAGWAILIGENGVGKSSTLSATLKTLIGRSYTKLKFNKSDVKRGQDDESRVIVSFEDGLISEASFKDKSKYLLPINYFIDNSILAFGPFKHSNVNDSHYRKFKGGCFVDNFLNPSVPLHNAQRFILRLTSEQFNYVAIALLDLLMLENKAKIDRDIESEEVWYEKKDSGEKHFFNQLSDGYQSVITLGCNIIEGLLFNNESIENASGFVIIDEIGANLHPRWKMQIVKRLRRTFPNVQFLVTTHDPLCLKGIEEGETYVLKSNNGELEVLTDLPNPSEYRADQLLTSEFFGLFSTVDPDMEEDFKEYYELLYKGKDSLNNDDKQRFQNLKEELREKNHLGDSLREELVYIAIDEIIVKHKESDKPFSRKEVEKDVKEKAIELIDEFLSDLEE